MTTPVGGGSGCGVGGPAAGDGSGGVRGGHGRNRTAGVGAAGDQQGSPGFSAPMGLGGGGSGCAVGGPAAGDGSGGVGGGHGRNRAAGAGAAGGQQGPPGFSAPIMLGGGGSRCGVRGPASGEGSDGVAGRHARNTIAVEPRSGAQQPPPGFNVPMIVVGDGPGCGVRGPASDALLLWRSGGGADRHARTLAAGDQQPMSGFNRHMESGKVQGTPEVDAGSCSRSWKGKDFILMLAEEEVKNKMMLPLGVQADFAPHIGHTVCIQCPTGDEHTVLVEGGPDGVFFAQGWSDLVRDEPIMPMYQLVFTHTAYRTLRVTIFDELDVEVRVCRDETPGCPNGSDEAIGGQETPMSCSHDSSDSMEDDGSSSEDDNSTDMAEFSSEEDVDEIGEAYYNVAANTRTDDHLIDRFREIHERTILKTDLYAVKLKPSALQDSQMFFSKEFSKRLPPNQGNIRMKYEHSDVITDAVLWKDKKGISRITKGWAEFRAKHNLSADRTYIFSFTQTENGSWRLLVYNC